MGEDIYFSKNKKSKNPGDISFANNRYTEKIDKSLLGEIPGNLSFNDIKTETGYIKAPDMTKIKKKKKSRKKRVLKILAAIPVTFIVLVLIAVTAAQGLVSSLLKDYEAKEFESNPHISDSQLDYSGNVFNLLLIGTDTISTENTARSDAMILMSVDKAERKIKLTSFLRDSYVDIPSLGKNRLNAACVYGGPQLVCDTIEYNFGIRIDAYAAVGYDMFIKIIDSVGGITVPEIDKTEAEALKKAGFDAPVGTNIELSGYETLLYCRIRSGQSDFYRTERQREVITQFFEKLPSADAGVFFGTLKEISASAECTLKKKELPVFFTEFLYCLTGTIAQFTVPADGTWHDETIDYMAVLVIDTEKNKEALRNFLY